jgi:hypothetical protein
MEPHGKSFLAGLVWGTGFTLAWIALHAALRFLGAAA